MVAIKKDQESYFPSLFAINIKFQIIGNKAHIMGNKCCNLLHRKNQKNRGDL